MKRNKDEDKDDGVVSGATAAGVANTNNNAKFSNNAASNTSGNSNDANSGSGGTAGTVRTTGRVKVSFNRFNKNYKCCTYAHILTFENCT